MHRDVPAVGGLKVQRRRHQPCHGQDLHLRQVPPGAQVHAAPVRHEALAARLAVLARHGRAVHEAPGVEGVRVAAPDGLAHVQHEGRDHDALAPLEEDVPRRLGVRQHRVLQHRAVARRDAAEAQGFLVGGEEQGAGGLADAREVEFHPAARRVLPSRRRCHDGLQLRPERGEELGLREDVDDHPDRGRRGVDRCN